MNDLGVFCRKCLPNGKPEHAKRYRDLLRLVFPERFEPDNALPPRKPRRTSPPRREPGDPGPTDADAPPQPNPDEEKKVQQAFALWQAAQPADASTPAARYLVGRRAWPEGEPLPKSVRWLPVSAAPPHVSLYGIPSDAAGCVVYGFKKADGKGRAVSLDALDANDKRTSRRWRPTRGPKRGAWFEVLGGPQAPVIALVEGEADALAARWLCGGMADVRAVGGTSGFTLAACEDETHRPLLLLPDGDREGRRSAYRLADQLHENGRRCEVLRLPNKRDPADITADLAKSLGGLRDLAAVVAERADWGEELRTERDLKRALRAMLT